MMASVAAVRDVGGAGVVVDEPGALVPVDPTVLEQRGTELARTVDEFTVDDQASFEQAAGLRRTLKLFLARVAADLDPVVAAAYRGHQAATALRKKLRDPAERAEQILRGRMDAYEATVEAERVRREAAAELERGRLLVEAERLATEANATLAQESIEDQLAEALAAEDEGDPERAAIILQRPITVPVVTTAPVFVPPVAIVAPRAPGVTYSTTWKAEITSLMDLVRAVASGRVPLMVTLPNGKLAPIFEANQAWLDAQARAQKETLRIPGVKAVPVRRSAVSA